MFEAILESRGLLVLSFLAAFLLYSFGVVGYRLYFSPIAKFPGPKLAAATYLYEGFYDGKFQIVGRHHVQSRSKYMSLIYDL